MISLVCAIFARISCARREGGRSGLPRQAVAPAHPYAPSTRAPLQARTRTHLRAIPRFARLQLVLGILAACLFAGPLSSPALATESAPPIAQGHSAHSATQAPILAIDARRDHWPLEDNLQITQSIPADASIEDIASGRFDQAFVPANGRIPNLDGNHGPVWAKIAIRNTTNETSRLRLVLKNPQPRSIRFFTENEDGTFHTLDRGSAEALQGNMAGRFPAARLRVPPKATRTAYLRIEDASPLLLPLQAMSAGRFNASMTADNLVYGLMIGFLLAIGSHAALSFASARKAAFGWFVLFSLASAGYILTASGIAKALIYPGLAFDSGALLIAAQSLANMAGVLFAASYLKMHERAPRLHLLICAVAAIDFVSAFGGFFEGALAMALLTFSVLIGPTILFAANCILAWRKVPGARKLLIGWSAIQAATVWVFLQMFDLVPYSELSTYALPLAATFAALHFSWALTDSARQAEHRAMHDPLTGLPNRFALEMLDRDMRLPGMGLAAVMQVDLDGFKRVNDTLGHAAGDHVLQVVAERIKKAVHGDGRVFRLGGDEFAIAVPRTRNPVNLESLGNRIIIAASQLITFRGIETHTGASVGVARMSGDDVDLAEMLERADAALYRAKRSGKGHVCFSPERALDRGEAEFGEDFEADFGAVPSSAERSENARRAA